MHMRTPAIWTAQSSSVVRKFWKMRGLSVGSAERSDTCPRELGLITHAP